MSKRYHKDVKKVEKKTLKRCQIVRNMTKDVISWLYLLIFFDISSTSVWYIFKTFSLSVIFSHLRYIFYLFLGSFNICLISFLTYFWNLIATSLSSFWQFSRPFDICLTSSWHLFDISLTSFQHYLHIFDISTFVYNSIPETDWITIQRKVISFITTSKTPSSSSKRHY